MLLLWSCTVLRNVNVPRQIGPIGSKTMVIAAVDFIAGNGIVSKHSVTRAIIANPTE